MDKLTALLLAVLLATAGGTATAQSAPDHPGQQYLQQLSTQLLTELQPATADEAGIAQAIYEQLVATVWFAPPVGMDSWRWRQGDSGQPLGYLESRALSPLAFGLGSCEDYAAAFVLLARQAGLQARYLPGITLSVNGDWVDHAWAAVQVAGRWYHVDPQLEDNITRQNLLRYRYFLLTDNELLPDHRWGQSLLETATLTESQRQEVAAQWMFVSSTAPHSRPQPRQLPALQPPSRSTVAAALAQERTVYESEHGSLPPLVSDTTPPLFGAAGYGPPD